MNTELKLGKEIKDHFPEAVGQDDAKKNLGLLLEDSRKQGFLPPLAFIAPKGCGKTFMAELLCKLLNKPYIPINCSTIKNLSRFWNDLIIPHVANKEVTLFFDEASEIPKDVQMALLTILDVKGDKLVNSFSHEDYTVDFDLRKVSFIFATTEGQSIFHALMDRLDRIELEVPSPSDLQKIMAKNCKKQGVTFAKDVLKDISLVLRGNARTAANMCRKINNRSHGKKKKVFTRKDWDYLKGCLGILPFGVSKIEYSLLSILYERKSCSLKELQAVTGLSKECLMRDIELYLQKLNLMKIDEKGRALTQKGVQYVKKHGQNNK